MTDIPSLDTLRLRLRPWRESDVEPLARITADPEVARYLFGDRPLDADGARAAYERRVASWETDGLGFWAVELKATGDLIGWAGLQVARRARGLEGAIEVGWMLGRQWWGNGYAIEAADASVRWGFRDRGIQRIYTFHSPENRRSERVMDALGMIPGGDATDLLDGSVSRVRLITRDLWSGRVERSGMANPHSNPYMLAAVMGYDVEGIWAALSTLSVEGVREALLATIARSWPGGRLPGEPTTHEVTEDFAGLAADMAAERMAGLVPLLVCVRIAESADAGDRLTELYVVTLQEGVWLHVDIAGRHGLELQGLERADSIAFDVPTTEGRNRLFATRHPSMLDGGFRQALGVAE